MLQQTQIVTVFPYFERWITRFPTVEALATAELDSVRAAWAGLGYYRRAGYLHEGARYIVANGWPRSAKEWGAVPGVGRYTAGAIASVVFGEAVAAVDGNVERVFCRFTADDSVGAVRNRKAWDWATGVLNRTQPGIWNQAVMELGATVCTPARPKCERCPIQSGCEAFATGEVVYFPVKAARKPPVILEQQVVVSVEGDQVALVRAEKGSWWEGLWQFPYEPRDERGEHRLTHVVTGHKIDLFVRQGEPVEPVTWFSSDEARELALPAPHRRVLAWALKT